MAVVSWKFGVEADSSCLTLRALEVLVPVEISLPERKDVDEIMADWPFGGSQPLQLDQWLKPCPERP